MNEVAVRHFTGLIEIELALILALFIDVLVASFVAGQLEFRVENEVARVVEPTQII